ncbi:patatin-like phospholipase family protein [Nautilia sp.]
MKLQNLPQVFHKNRFSLVLSGGGALGFAHAGIIRALEKENLIPAEIVGSSMGAVIGACYAVGMKSGEIKNLILKFHSYTKWLRPSLADGFVSIKKIYEIFEEVFREEKIENTQIPLKIISYSLTDNECAVFEEGLIKDALTASISVPGIFESAKIGDKEYADGCLCENLPVSFAKYSYVLAVNVLNGRRMDTDRKIKNCGMFERLELFTRILLQKQSECVLKTQYNRRIFLIEPELKNFNMYDFNKTEITNVGDFFGKWLES